MAILKNEHLTAEISPLGATLTRLWVDGLPVAERGNTHGRFANRIANATFELGGVTYHLAANEGKNILHGGPGGFARREWEETVESDCAAVYRLVSADGDQGFPGTMKVEVRYTLAGSALRLDYLASCDKRTVINLTNHAYFNLNGLENGKLHGAHTLQIDADGYLEADEGLIPTGTVLPTAGTRFDFREGCTFEGNYDHCFVLNDIPAGKHVAVLRGSESGLRMEVFTDLPAMQLYNTADRMCLETQGFPDAIHHENFPSCVLPAGHSYVTTTEYRFSREK